jgi:UDP-N-acetylglucosamine 4-epimerase
VIPRWVRAALTGEPVEINGDGETTRDFCYVANVVQANLHAALTDNAQALGRVYNIAVGESTSLNALLELICSLLGEPAIERIHRPFRAGDVRHSRADIALARQLLDYRPSHALANGLREALPWYVTRFAAPATAD